MQEKCMNSVVHFEIGGTDIAKSSAFYSALFGWKILNGPAKMIEIILRRLKRWVQRRWSDR
jgi:predicted enzyme related to lactoylglutathione lyase